MCIRRQEGCYLSKWPQSLKNSTCATQWSVPCPPLHHTKALHPPCQPRENRSCHICQWVLGIFVLLDLFTSFFPIHLPVNDHVTFYSRQPHTPCTRADEAFSSRDTSPASYALWLHHLQEWGSGRNHLPFCQCGEKQHANWAQQRLEICIRLQAELQMLIIGYGVINRHQTTAQPSFGKWGKRYSPVTRCSKSKSHSPSFSSNFEPGLMHSGDCPSSCTFCHK